MPYFQRYARRQPTPFPAMSERRHAAWHLLAGLTTGLGLWYLAWRWSQSLNPEALTFSILVALAETLCLIGTLLFFHDIWREVDTPAASPPETREAVGLPGGGPVTVDLMITTYDEGTDIVAPSVAAALALEVPQGVTVQIWLCDDGNRPEMAALAGAAGVGYLARTDNRGFKAGNLRHALFTTKGDFVAICDADTRVLPGFLANTLGYFRDPSVAWVQTPHWFYDIPPGRDWAVFLARSLGRPAACLAPLMRSLTGQRRAGADPFLADPVLFFDVIQRRRNRNGASFCCGAGSVHRREAIFQGALAQLGRDLAGMEQRFQPRNGRRSFWPRFRTGNQPESSAGTLLSAIDLQPFRYHVSEDILTSILLHSDVTGRWRSVYHPQVECRMLSTCSLEAWSVQRLKYSGGTFDIMLRANPLFRRGMPWRTKLHYAATFWSYLSALWMPVLLFAPAVALAFGTSPVVAYSWTFFIHLIPMLVVNEMAMLVACKGHNIHQGRILALACLPIQWRALVSVLRGRRPRFPVTPKSLRGGGMMKYLWPNLAILASLAAASGIGIWRHAIGDPDMPLPLLVTNLFWIVVNGLAVGWMIPAAFQNIGQNTSSEAITTPAIPAPRLETADVLTV